MEQSKGNLRLLILLAFIMLMMFIFIIRLMNLQLVEGEYYSEQAVMGVSYEQEITGARGEIVDRYGSPFSYNKLGYDATLNRALMPEGIDNNDILEILDTLSYLGEEWITDIPITETTPYTFTDDEADVSKLKNVLEIAEYATVEDAIYWLSDRYGIEDFSEKETRDLIGVRYSMEQAGFSISTPYTLSENISAESAIYIGQISGELVGVEITETPIRANEDGDLAPHIIGTVGSILESELEGYLEEGYARDDTVGRDGIERLLEDELKGENGSRIVTLDHAREIESIETTVPPTPGNTVSLTLDKNLQETALASLEEQIKYLNETAPEGEGKEADSGAVAAIDIKTGEILVLASYPNYDISTLSQDYNTLIEDPLNPLFNRALQGQYAPGSIFKPLVGLAALNEGTITENTTIPCSGTYYFSPTYNPTCLGVHGDADVVYALTRSCNVFFYDCGLNLGINTINKYAAMLGLGEPTGVELYEELGSYSDPETVNPGDALQTGIGQGGNTYTPIQLAQYTANLARYGEIIPTTLIRSISSYNFEEEHYTHQPEMTDKADIPAEYFDTIIEGMIDASSIIGTAGATFGNYPITVASKTGTPQTGDLPNSTFIAFAPAEDPQIAIAVVIEKGWHGYTGAPVAKAIFDEVFFPESTSADSITPNNTLLP